MKLALGEFCATGTIMAVATTVMSAPWGSLGPLHGLFWVVRTLLVSLFRCTALRPQACVALCALSLAALPGTQAQQPNHPSQKKATRVSEAPFLSMGAAHSGARRRLHGRRRCTPWAPCQPSQPFTTHLDPAGSGSGQQAQGPLLLPGAGEEPLCSCLTDWMRVTRLLLAPSTGEVIAFLGGSL